MRPGALLDGQLFDNLAPQPDRTPARPWGEDHHELLEKLPSHRLSNRKVGLMAHKALKAHTSPAPKPNTRTLSALSALSAHIFPEEIAPTSPRLQIGPSVTNLVRRARGNKLINFEHLEHLRETKDLGPTQSINLITLIILKTEQRLPK